MLCPEQSVLLDLPSIFLKIPRYSSRVGRSSPACLRGQSRNGGAEIMRWWRFRRAGAASLGLLALMLQLFVSFGHIHSRDLVQLRTVVATSTEKPTIQKQVPNGLPDDDCLICSTMHMASSGLLPAPPSLASPAEFSQVFLQAFVEDLHLGVPRHLLFQTRAPPTA